MRVKILKTTMASGEPVEAGKTYDLTDNDAKKLISFGKAIDPTGKVTGPPPSPSELDADGGGKSDVGPNAKETIKLIKAATTTDDLAVLAEGEDRKSVLEAIEAKKAELEKG